MLLTGGSGFIGRNIIETAPEWCEITAPRHSELELTDQKSVDSFFESHELDAVIHCAVKPGHRNAGDTSDLLKCDLQMFYNLARNTEPRGVKLLSLGSGCCYDMRNYRPKMKEEDMGANIPADDTGLAKYISSLHALSSKHIYDLRVFGIFGKYEDYAIRFISNAACKAVHGLPITIKQNRKFDYIQVDDFVKILEIFLKNEPERHAYNITPDSSVSLYDLAVMVRSAAGRHDLPIQVAEEGIGLEYSGDNSLFREEFGFGFTPVEESVKSLTEWYKSRIDSIDKNLLMFDK